MRWASALSVRVETRAAVAEAAAAVRAQLGAEPDLAVVFVSTHHAGEYERIPQALADELGTAAVIGCSAGGVIGAGHEVEGAPGLSLTAALLPDVSLTVFHVEDPPPGADETSAWERYLGVQAASLPSFIVLPDPFGFDVDALLQGLDRTFPKGAVIGGIASGARQPGDGALFSGGHMWRSGAVGLALTGNIEVVTMVAQGCRPIGQPMFVTKCQSNVLWELDGRPAFEVLKQLFESLTRADQDLVRHSLFLGIVMKDDRSEYRQGDFLIRNLLGMDPERGILAVGAPLTANSVVQFHLRDAQTSTQDLESILERYAPDAAPQGALLFSCLGRGRFLYGEPDHETNAFRRHLGNVPLGGFFCNGEIGPVHGTTFLHGYTSSFGLFRPRR